MTGELPLSADWEEWVTPEDSLEHAGDLVEVMNLETRKVVFEGVVRSWIDMLGSGGIVAKSEGTVGSMDFAIKLPQSRTEFREWAERRRFRVKKNRLEILNEQEAA